MLPRSFIRYLIFNQRRARPGRSESAEDLRNYLAAEPYTSNGVMVFSAMTEFFPRQHSPLLTPWFT
jgi:hypothetical protein